MKIVSIIQARMNSSRLPGKVLLKVDGKNIIDYLIKRVRKLKNIDEIVISTTLNPKDKHIVNYCIKNKIKYFRGEEYNVLKRVYKTAKFFEADIVIFITGDCPIIDPKILKKLLNYFIKNKNKIDYVGNAFIRSYPDGMDAHVFNFNTLKKNFLISKKKLEREHVTLGIKNNPKLFKIKNFIAPKALFWPELGLTLDEKEDYLLLKKIISYFNKKKKYYFDCFDVVSLLRNKKKEWVKINSHIIRKGDT